MKPENKPKYDAQPLDEDKPGLGQHVSFINQLGRRVELMIVLHPLCKVS